MATRIPHNETIGFGERGYLWLPLSSVTSNAIDENQRKSGTMAFIVDVDAVYFWPWAFESPFLGLIRVIWTSIVFD